MVKKMEEKYYKCYKADAIVEFNPADRMRNAVKRTDDIIKYIVELRNGVAPDYVEALIKRMLKEVNGYTVDTKSVSLNKIKKDLTQLKQGDLLTNLVIRYMAMKLEIPKDSKIPSKKAEFTNFNQAMAHEGMNYYRVKAFEDVLGKKEGIKLYTDVLKLIVKEMRSKEEPNEKDTVKSRGERAVNWWCKSGVGDFTFKIYDENKIIYRFDKCVTHEVLKHHNDPDIAYIASCFIGDIDEWNEGEFIHLKRTQTLHHADFCDELYWDTRAHDNPEIPSLDFTRKIGKDKK
jgi:hypothetical protein